MFKDSLNPTSNLVVTTNSNSVSLKNNTKDEKIIKEDLYSVPLFPLCLETNVSIILAILESAVKTVG